MDRLNLLPAEIISDILARLPAELVLECKLVSNTWKNLIQHPMFSKMHTDHLINHSAAAYSTDSSKLGFLAFTNIERLYYFEYIENRETHIRRINLTPPYKRDTFVGSFNGLICLRGPEERFSIYNPITKEYVNLPRPKIPIVQEYVLLPEPKISVNQCNSWIGFGYLPSTNEYKVVLMYKAKFVEVMVYTLGSGNGWRKIGKFDLKFDNVDNEPGIFANGALHWMHENGNMILVFHLTDENISEHLSPPYLYPCWFSDSGLSNEFLFGPKKSYTPFNKKYLWHYIRWLYEKNDNDDMNDQDEHHSLGWPKEFTAPDSIPLAFTKSGEVLDYGSSYLHIYDPKTSTSKELVDFKEHLCQAFHHNNSFVSLKELGEEGTKLMQSVKSKKRKGCD